MDELRELISGKSCVFLGVGNQGRGDDYIGSYVVSKLRTENKIDCGPVPENFTGKIRKLNPEVIIIIDAVDFGGRPGESVFTLAEKAKGVVLSTHALPLSLFCKLFPESRVYLLGIQPENFIKMSETVKKAGDSLAEKLNSLLK